eukprot:CAMPEP_0174848136 /NCGR_PEP_ID=MMETSP1114-20130205/13343_1 /TAXON_ID=312471 /ORGANISM="Neobodo designis, Strain CCAP 1951/1" /LENGTH=230 /DNA_ID=CAMNT_0016082435 /DNA_START=47 /DNA_END=736 /DNA_ORIENTATION=+
MSEALLQQWRDRVAEVEAQLDAVRDELQSVHEQKEQLSAQRDTFAKREKTAKATLLGELKDLEGVVTSIDDANKAAVKQRADAEKAQAAAQAGYDELAATVKALQRQERSLKTREDLGATLESESALWEQEESEMRESIRSLETQVESQRGELKQQVRDAQAELKEAEAELKAARQRRAPHEGTEEVTLEALEAIVGGRASASRQSSRAPVDADDVFSRVGRKGVKRTVL